MVSETPSNVVYLMVKMTGCNDTLLEVKVLASPKGVTLSGEPCTTFLLFYLNAFLYVL